MNMEESARFKYNLSLEYVVQDLFGRESYGGIAGAFCDVDFCKKCMFRVIKRIRRRLSILFMDERLRRITGIILDRLEENLKETSEEVNNDWDIIANLLDLIVHLLGYDWLDGRIHRHVFFYQNSGQEQLDWNYEKGRAYFEEWRKEDIHRSMIVNFLRKNQIPKYQIANLLRISVRRVNRILQEIEDYEKETGKSFPRFEKSQN